MGSQFPCGAGRLRARGGHREIRFADQTGPLSRYSAPSSTSPQITPRNAPSSRSRHSPHMGSERRILGVTVAEAEYRFIADLMTSVKTQTPSGGLTTPI